MALAGGRGQSGLVLCATNGDQGGRPGEMDVDHSLDPRDSARGTRLRLRGPGCQPSRSSWATATRGMEGWGAPDGSLSARRRGGGRRAGRRRHPALRPAVIVTFDPGGVYGHPDHVACSTIATAAYFRRAARNRAGRIALYHQALPRSGISGACGKQWRRSAAAPVTRAAVRGRPPPARGTSRGWPGRTRRSPRRRRSAPALDRKVAALACHDSQMRGRGWDDPEGSEASWSGCSAGRRSCGWIRRPAGRAGRTGSRRSNGPRR